MSRSLKGRKSKILAPQRVKWEVTQSSKGGTRLLKTLMLTFWGVGSELDSPVQGATEDSEQSNMSSFAWELHVPSSDGHFVIIILIDLMGMVSPPQMPSLLPGSTVPHLQVF